MSGQHTPGPWHVRDAGPHWNNPSIPNYRVVRAPTPSGPHGYDVAWSADGELVAEHVYEEADARLIAAAPTMADEMRRYLPVIERAEADPALWERLTAGLGIATANGYRAAIAAATGSQP